MDSIMIFENNVANIAACAAIVASVVGAVIYFVCGRGKKERICGKDYPKDTIILHVFPRERGIPNLGHFAVKLETYLRVNKLPYKADCVYRPGPKNKIPWIEYNGVTMGDSQLIIEFLESEFNISLNSNISKEERAIAWSIQKWIEEWIYWLSVHTRWNIHGDEFFKQVTSLPSWIKPFFKPQMRKLTNTVGVGRHTEAEVAAMLDKDLRYFSAILGKKPFIMGTKISDVDCAAFGILSQIRWATPDSCQGKRLLTNGELKNVAEYLDRIKTIYYPDWEELTTPKK